MKVYLAGPDVFLPDAVEVLESKRALCGRHGLQGLVPLDGTAPGGGSPAGATDIFRSNRALMDQADLGLFNLSPFRGPSADVGTVFELGYLFAKGRPVFGYTSDPATLTERTLGFLGRASSEGLVDPAGHTIEDFTLRDNLMIDEALRDSSGVFCAAAAQDSRPLAAVEAFAVCVDAVARWLDCSHSEGTKP